MHTVSVDTDILIAGARSRRIILQRMRPPGNPISHRRSERVPIGILQSARHLSPDSRDV